MKDYEFDPLVIIRPELLPLVNEQLLFAENNFDVVHLMSSEVGIWLMLIFTFFFRRKVKLMKQTIVCTFVV